MKKIEPSKVVLLKPHLDTSESTAEEDTKVLYAENISSPISLRILIYGFFFILVSFFIVFPFLEKEANHSLHLFLCMVFTAVAWIIHIFLSMKISMYRTRLQFGFFIFSKKVPYYDIMSATVHRFKFFDAVGLGVRKGFDDSMIFTVPGTPLRAVKISVLEEDGTRSEIIFSAKRPEVICKKIQAYKEKTPAKVSKAENHVKGPKPKPKAKKDEATEDKANKSISNHH